MRLINSSWDNLLFNALQFGHPCPLFMVFANGDHLCPQIEHSQSICLLLPLYSPITIIVGFISFICSLYFSVVNIGLERLHFGQPLPLNKFLAFVSHSFLHFLHLQCIILSTFLYSPYISIVFILFFTLFSKISQLYLPE